MKIFYVKVLLILMLLQSFAFAAKDSVKTKTSVQIFWNEARGLHQGLSLSLSLPAYWSFARIDTGKIPVVQFPVWKRKAPRLHNRLFSISKRSLIKPGLIGGAIVFNWLSFYLKRRADKFYTRYQRTSSINRMNSYYDQSNRYDRFSDAALVLSVSCLSVFLYLLLTD